VAENGRKVKAITLLFCRFSPLYEKSNKWLKMDELQMDKKLRLYIALYFFADFRPFLKNRKSG
jgi:hypothetical protein